MGNVNSSAGAFLFSLFLYFSSHIVDGGQDLALEVVEEFFASVSPAPVGIGTHRAWMHSTLLRRSRVLSVATSAEHPMVLFAIGINHHGKRTWSASVTGDAMSCLTPKGQAHGGRL